MISLEALSRCFQGVVPAFVATSSTGGEPNATMISQVYYVDPTHVALSCQFFNKTRRNFGENPHACVQVIDPLTAESYRLRLRYHHSETSGPLFDEMALRIDAIASHTGMSGIFKLIAADVFEVDAVETVENFLHPAQKEHKAVGTIEGPLTELRGLQVLSEVVNRARDLDELLQMVLETLDRLFGFTSSMVLLVDDSGQRLVTLASRGYGAEGAGAEIAIGDGLIGAVARERRLHRVAGIAGELRYGRAIRGEVEKGGHTAAPEIPLPGLVDAQSQLAAPLVVQDRLVGVLASESKNPLCFAGWHDAFLQILANQVAFGIDRMLEREQDDAEAEASAQPAVPDCPPDKTRRTFLFYKADDCVFVDGEYLIRNVPGKILWRLLNAFRDEGRTEFSNRELRLDPWLGLPPLKDNLESRLILLRKRLAEKCPDVRIVPTRRGRFALDVCCIVELVEKH